MFGVRNEGVSPTAKRVRAGTDRVLELSVTLERALALWSGLGITRIANLTDHSEKSSGEWNRMVIECAADRIRVWVNDDLVNEGFDCTARRGHIAIQAEGAPVEFRTLEIEPLATGS